jgi:dTDP-glucose pyrophosphorylase
MRNWREALVPGNASLKDAMEAIDKSATQIAVVVSAERKLLGTVTDGDVRRALLRGIPLSAPVREVMSESPTRARLDQSLEATLALMQSRGLHQVPIVDGDDVVVGLEVIDDLLRAPERPNWVVVMAGGLGERLRPLTEHRPKPMLPVGGRPILEHILDSLVVHGYRRFFFAVNYLGHMIQDHFGDGGKWGAQIEYLCERERLGTAGALQLLPEKPKDTFIVMNGDLMTKVNYPRLVDFHAEHAAAGTMCVRNYEYQIPFGVVAIDGQQLKGVREKPKERCFVSAGIYSLSPSVLDLITPEEVLDMPSLFQRLIKSRSKTIVFPLADYWLDIGRNEDYEQANGDYERGIP